MSYTTLLGKDASFPWQTYFWDHLGGRDRMFKDGVPCQVRELTRRIGGGLIDKEKGQC